MTKDEIKALVSAKIAGQGNQVDLGNVLPTILNEIIDLHKPNAPLKFTSTGNSTIGLTNNGGNAPKLFKSTNGIDWEDWDYSSISLADGESVYIKGKNGAFSSRMEISRFTGSGSLDVEGNIMSLLDDYVHLIAPYAFTSLFSSNTAIKDAKGLILPATTLATSCYSGMFKDCTSLESAPELSATTLAESCYQEMFMGCTSLESAPELPVTTLASNCYRYMFKGCTSLESAPELPATTLVGYCYQEMFMGCTSLESAPELPATTLATSCYSGMFKGCTSLESSPELLATTLAESCYQEMFSNCTSLESAPELPATTLAIACYRSMFKGCTLINDIIIKATTIGTNSLSDWLKDTSESGTIHCDSTMVVTFEGNANTPAGWNVSAYN